MSENYHMLMKAIEPHIVHIETTSGSGTGFLVYRNPTIIAIATAYHVVEQCARLNTPMRVRHTNQARRC